MGLTSERRYAAAAALCCGRWRSVQRSERDGLEVAVFFTRPNCARRCGGGGGGARAAVILYKERRGDFAMSRRFLAVERLLNFRVHMYIWISAFGVLFVKVV